MTNLRHKLRSFSTFKIYTRTGDRGTTFLNSETGRLPKYSKILHVIGEIDELSCSISVAKEHCGGIGRMVDGLTDAQYRLQDINSLLAAPFDNFPLLNTSFPDHVVKIESQIDEMTNDLDPLRSFIIPSGGMASSHLHLSRAICRRTERSLCLYLSEVESKTKEEHFNCLRFTEIYLNRLSDYLFTAARYCAKVQGYQEVTYSSRIK